MVGVIANLALWFGLRVAFGEVQSGDARPAPVGPAGSASVNVQALVLSALAAVCLFRLRLGVVRTPGVAAAAGLALRVLLG